STQDLRDRTIQYVDIAFFSLTGENKREAEQLAKRITERGPSLVVVTLGSGGSLAFDGVFYHQPIIPVEVFDTLGAGDTYIGTFLGHWLQGRPVPECMGQAARQAARTCTFLGAWSQVSIEETRFPVMPKG
ncbi:MAG: PfkB family carbohydrate kinase, partial [Chloroflexi bacterium]|nr:PfkB family carbohydrate kinase [Chloroflexota bacterium]